MFPCAKALLVVVLALVNASFALWLWLLCVSGGLWHVSKSS